MSDVPSRRGTTKPVPLSGCVTCVAIEGQGDVADEAYGISPHQRGERPVRPVAARLPRPRPASATMTARDWMIAPFESVNVNGLATPSILATALLYCDGGIGSRREQRLDDLARCPPETTRTRRWASAAPAWTHSARSRLPCDALGSTSRGNSACTERRSTSPA